MNPIDQLKAVLCDPNGKCCIDGSDEDRAIVDRALQALAQGRKPWVGLTDKEILDLWVANHKNTGATDAFACAVEAKLKEKNT